MTIIMTDRLPGFIPARWRTAATAFIVGTAALSILSGSWYTIDQTQRGVLLRNGRLVDVKEPGLHLKLPWFDRVALVGVNQRSVGWVHTDRIDNRQEAYSADQQPAKLTMSVLWHIPAGSVAQLYGQYRDAQAVQANLIERRVPQAVKTIFGQFTAVSAIQDRAKLNANAAAAVLSDPDIAKAPIVIDGVQIEDIQFSTSYIQSVESAMQARVEVQRLEQQKQQQEVQATITVIRAKADADARVAEATARAKAVALAGDAEASAIRAKGEALKENPALVDLIRTERWNGVLPTTMVPGSAVPFMNLK